MRRRQQNSSPMHPKLLTYIAPPLGRVMRFFKVLILLLLTCPIFAYAVKLREIALLDIPGRPGFETLAFAKGFLVLAHNGASTVDIFDPAKRRFVAQISGIVSARGVAVDDTNSRVYIADAGSNSIDVVNSNNWQVEERIALSRAPENLLLVPGTTNIIASNPYARSLTLVSHQINREMQIVDVGGDPDLMAYDPIRNAVFLTLEDQNAVVAYPVSLERDAKPLKTIKLNASQPTGIILEPTSRTLFVAVRYAVLSLDADSGTELSRVPVVAGTDRLWLDPTGSALYGASSDGTVTTVKVNGRQLAYESEIRTDVKGHSLAFDPERKVIYVPGGREGKSKMVILKQFGALPVNTDEVKTASAVSR
ncbi:MAG TPA: YncE family protein [Terriglobales bacterium]|nr:YncE family protein [Terriglobales bacterium]